MRRSLLVLAAVLLAAGRASAVEIQVKEVKTESSVVRATVEIESLVPDRFRKLLDDNGALHLRIEGELWEARPVWDRLVYPAVVHALRMTRTTIPSNPLRLVLELGKSDRIADTGRYYVHAVATIGTVAERDPDEVEDAVFGRPSESSSLGSLGRLVIRTALQLSDYLQSVTAETKSKKIPGRDLRR